MVIEVLDNLLADINNENLASLDNTTGGSENILENVERYALYSAQSTPLDVEYIPTNFSGKNLGLCVIISLTQYKMSFNTSQTILTVPKMFQQQPGKSDHESHKNAVGKYHPIIPKC